MTRTTRAERDRFALSDFPARWGEDKQDRQLQTEARQGRLMNSELCSTGVSGHLRAFVRDMLGESFLPLLICQKMVPSKQKS
jgi:hypothetical protein